MRESREQRFLIMIGIYKITSPIGRVYVGQSKNIKKRIADHSWNRPLNLNRKLDLSIHTYGRTLHIIEIIEECRIEDLNERERFWQEYYDCASEYGLNSMLTGTKDKPCVFSKEHKERIIKANTGSKMTEEAKIKMRNAKLGIKLSEERKLKMSLSRIGSKKGMNFKRYTPYLNVETGIYYDTIKDAAFSIGIPHQSLWSMIYPRGQRGRQGRSRRIVLFIRA